MAGRDSRGGMHIPNQVPEQIAAERYAQQKVQLSLSRKSAEQLADEGMVHLGEHLQRQPFGQRFCFILSTSFAMKTFLRLDACIPETRG